MSVIVFQWPSLFFNQILFLLENERFTSQETLHIRKQYLKGEKKKDQEQLGSHSETLILATEPNGYVQDRTEQGSCYFFEKSGRKPQERHPAL